MISNELQYIFLISISISILHNFEEYITRLREVDITSKFISRYFKLSQGSHHLFQILFWVFLAVIFLFTADQWPLWLMALFGLIYILELHHFWKALTSRRYNQGLITAFLFPIIGLFFWKALIGNF